MTNHVDTVGPIQTGNDTFDKAFARLRKYHLCQHWPGGDISLAIFQRPIGLLSMTAWSLYLDALLTVVNIGRENDWIRERKERSGRVGYLILDGTMEAPQDEKGN